MPTTALIVAAGAGLRMGLPSPKAFLDLAGRPVVDYSLAVFDAHPRIDGIVVMAPRAQLAEAGRIAARYGRVREVAPGGERRQETVRLGLERVRLLAGGKPDDHLVLIHDAARPLIDAALVTAVIEATCRTGAAFPGLAPADTVRELAAGAAAGAPRTASRTLDRDRLVLVQTPQGFRLPLLLEAWARHGASEVTDDAAVAQMAGHAVEVVPGSSRNLKITSSEDLEIAAALVAGANGRAGRTGR